MLRKPASSHGTGVGYPEGGVVGVTLGRGVGVPLGVGLGVGRGVGVPPGVGVAVGPGVGVAEPAQATSSMYWTMLRSYGAVALTKPCGPRASVYEMRIALTGGLV